MKTKYSIEKTKHDYIITTSKGKYSISISDFEKLAKSNTHSTTNNANDHKLNKVSVD